MEVFEENGGRIKRPVEKVGEYGRELVGGSVRPKTEAFLGVADGLAHGEDKVRDCLCGSIHESKAPLGHGHVQD